VEWAVWAVCHPVWATTKVLHPQIFPRIFFNSQEICDESFHRHPDFYLNPVVRLSGFRKLRKPQILHTAARVPGPDIRVRKASGYSAQEELPCVTEKRRPAEFCEPAGAGLIIAKESN
jgi:hypothetical protein